MGSKTRLSSYCTKRGDDTVNLATSRKTNARLAHPIVTGWGVMPCVCGMAFLCGSPSTGRYLHDMTSDV